MAYWANRVWALLGMMTGFLGVIFGIWALNQTTNSSFQGIMPDIIFFLAYLIALGGVYWLAKNQYNRALVYSAMLAIFLVVTVLFAVFGSQMTFVKLSSIILVLVIYILISKRVISFFGFEGES